MATDAKALLSAYIRLIRGQAPLSAFCILPSAFPHPTPSARATYQISHGEKFENGPVSPIPDAVFPRPKQETLPCPGRDSEVAAATGLPSRAIDPTGGALRSGAPCQAHSHQQIIQRYAGFLAR